jgi:Fe-S cluster assembly protein SufD
MRLTDLKNSSASEILETFGRNASAVKSAESLAICGLPDKKSEAYRYADIEQLLALELAQLEQSRPDEILPSQQLIITDGVVTHAPASVKLGYSKSIPVEGKHFDPIYHLGHVASTGIWEIQISGEVHLHIIHRFTKSTSLIPYRLALHVTPNSHASVYEQFVNIGATESLVLYGYDLFVGRDATIKMVKNQTLHSSSYHMLASHRCEVGTGATLDLSTFDFGSASALQLMQIALGERAHVEASHLLYASGNAKRGTVSKILHIGEGSTSNQQAKSILGDSARGIFDALIKVEHSAKYTKAHQNSKAILLETGAYMASKPQLEIYIDELEASHGSTTGQLDGKQLFYLRSRGISEVEARKMLIQAFANELIDAVDGDMIREILHRDFDEAFYGQTRVECIDTCHGCEDAILSEGD